MKNMKRISALLLAAVMLLCICPSSFAQEGVPEMKEYGFVDCNGAKIEYGIYGDLNGEPLLLLPPNGGDMHCFDDSVLPEMSKHFKVIAVSPRGTGNSDWIEGTMNFETMSDDLAIILDYLKIEKTNIFGFSDGGNLGVVFTLRYQDRVKSLVIMGSNINTLGTNTFDQIQITWQYFVLCVEAWITGDRDTKIRRDIKGMMVGQPSLTFKDISAIKVPVLNIYGEHDMIQRWHSRLITKSIEGAEEIMIIGGGHSTCFEFTDTIINPALLDFYGVTA
ncbi:MAG: alpha/beta hydrolase [Ruminococcaceae bacterium]|nr:alpha/beta hydrolase [Oscillospiraceae bacterium]